MTIPFLNLFKRKGKEQAAVFSQPAAPSVPKPSSERLSKTVTPNATRTAPPHDPFHAAANSNGNGSNGSSYGNAPRSISFGDMESRANDLPPAVAVALAPNIERVISLELRDIVQQLPAGIVKQLDNEDASQRLLLKAAEIEKGMASGKPTVSLGSLFQQLPEIFIKPIAASDMTPVSLPFAKVLEQFSSLQMRSDQYREQDVPQVETPFLQVTMEDNTRFGTKTGPVQTGALPPVRLETATAETIAAAEPEPVAPAKNPRSIATFKTAAPKPISMNGVDSKSNESFAPPAAPASATPTPTPTKFKLTPNGTDVPASERVPASNGASVPTSVRAPAAPTRIAFKMSPPAEEVVPKVEPWLTKDNFSGDASPQFSPPPPEPLEPEKSANISLPLKPILQTLPPFQLTGDVNGVPQDARIELPFALVEPQLATGRVSLSAEDFAAHLPEKYQHLFSSEKISAPIFLPLQEVLKNLPTASLRMRDDQVEQEKGPDFATPFSARAEEDAKRFTAKKGPVPKPAVIDTVPSPIAPPPELRPISAAPVTPLPEPIAAMPVVAAPGLEPIALKVERSEKPAKATGRTELQKVFKTDNELDPKGIVTQINLLPGVEACTIMFGDGLSLAGELPSKYEADGLCAMAPSLLRRIENHMVETKLGALSAMTLSCTNGAISFFLQDNICLAAVHAKCGLAGEVHERLTSVMHELSRTYSHPL